MNVKGDHHPVVCLLSSKWLERLTCNQINDYIRDRISKFEHGFRPITALNEPYRQITALTEP